MVDPGLRIAEAPAVGEAVGGQVDDAHDPRPVERDPRDGTARGDEAGHGFGRLGNQRLGGGDGQDLGPGAAAQHLDLGEAERAARERQRTRAVDRAGHRAEIGGVLHPMRPNPCPVTLQRRY